MSRVVTDLALPMTLDGVTAQWVGEALSYRYPGVQISAIARSAQRAGTSTSARLALTYADRAGHADLPSAVYVKGGFDEVMRRRGAEV